jgi:3-hydroxypropanoate dehydrogenase
MALGRTAEPLGADALAQLFGEARSLHRFLPRPVTDETIARLYELSKFGPTAFNSQPARYVFIRSEEGKRRLGPALSSNNRDKTLIAPLTVVVAWDSRFHEHLPEQFPSYDAKSFFEGAPALIEPSAKTSATLQAAYLFLAARALGLDVGPMSGFKHDLLDREFFPDGRFKSLMLANLGYGDREELRPRLPRLPFSSVARVL